MAATTITERMVALRDRPSPRIFAAAVATIIGQRRFAEVLYSAGSLLLPRPGSVARVGDAGPAFALANCRLAEAAAEDIALAK